MSEEKYKICPICGGRMLKDGSAWLCTNCEAILYEDRAIMPIVNDLTAQPVEYRELEYWCKFRAEAAKDILCAFASNSCVHLTKDNVDKFIEGSITTADMLVSKLKEDGKE